MDTLLQTIISYFEDWLDVSDTGKGELETAIAEMKKLTAVQPRAITPRALPVVDEWLPIALKNETAPHCEPIIEKLGSMYQDLYWTVAKSSYVGEAYSNKSAYTQIVGPAVHDGAGILYPSDKVAAGFMIMGPDLFYPPHAHTAVEYYGILTGLAEWQIYYNRPVFHPPGAHIFHPTEAPHAMQTHDEPMLLVWAWAGDIQPPYMIETNGGWL